MPFCLIVELFCCKDERLLRIFLYSFKIIILICDVNVMTTLIIVWCLFFCKTVSGLSDLHIKRESHPQT